MVTDDNVTPIRPEQTVAALKAAMTDRHGRGMVEAEKRLNSLSVEVVKAAAAEKIERTATDLADLGRLLADNRARLTTDPDDPIGEAHRLIVSLIQDYGVVEFLNGRGARRGQGQA